MSYTALSRAVREQLGQAHRFAHSVRVARFAERLAARHGCSTAAARRAGLLHDVARLYAPERLLAECAARGLATDAFERAHPIVLHARLGAEIAREFGERDEAVLQAIARHTVAADEMTAFDAVVYLADALEPGRDYPAREALAALAFDDLDLAMHDVIHSSVDHLMLRGEAVAPETAVALTCYQRRLARRERSPIPA